MKKEIILIALCLLIGVFIGIIISVLIMSPDVIMLECIADCSKISARLGSGYYEVMCDCVNTCIDIFLEVSK
jgi:hypothetical protein